MRELRERVARVAPEAAALDEQWGVPFSLENGMAELQPWFSPITLHRYEDGLRVTKVEPLVAYVLSGRYREMLVRDRLAAFIASVERDLAADGAIRISKSAGVFEARTGMGQQQIEKQEIRPVTAAQGIVCPPVMGGGRSDRD